MKKVINRKRYDTDTAKKVAAWNSGGSMSDFRYASEVLYRKKTGEFFLYGEGGAMSQWGKLNADNTRSWGEDLRPLTLDMAQDWTERYANEEYELLFGECEE